MLLGFIPVLCIIVINKSVTATELAWSPKVVLSCVCHFRISVSSVSTLKYMYVYVSQVYTIFLRSIQNSNDNTII